MANIYIENKEYAVKDGQNMLQACLSLGFDLPYFCWHPAMHSVGACRQCAVKQFKDEKDTRGKVVMSCMTPASNGTRISIDDPEAKEFRKSVSAWLMLNHPHDCPVCDEGGECHLQDMTVMTGHNYRDYLGRKRTFKNQYLGPLVNHEMNRCIQCYRCVRFYRDYAGGRDLDAFSLRNHVYFGRAGDGTLESEFSGNLVEVCPTGVFTDKTFKKHYTRKWDLQTAPSVCVHCGLGCNTIPGERYGKLRRIHNRFNSEVNGYFLCDRGRFGYEFVESDKRMRQPLLKKDGGLRPVSKKDALDHLSKLLPPGAKVIGIGSPRASLEANFVLRCLVGPDSFYTGMSEGDHNMISTITDILRRGPARSPSIYDVEHSDAIFVLGEDVTNSAPLLSLALRQSVRKKPMEALGKMGIPEWNDAAARNAIQGNKGPLFLATPYGTKLEDIATVVFHAAPDDLARLGFAVAHELDGDAPSVSGLPDQIGSLARTIANALKDAKRPLVVSGTGCGSPALLHAAANVAWALSKDGQPAGLCYAVPECNSVGLGLMGGGSIEEAFKAVQDRVTDAVIVLENDLYRRADAASVDSFLDRCRHVVVIDHVITQTSSRAEVALPAATFAESSGTLINNEARAQRFYKVFESEGYVRESRLWLEDIINAAGFPSEKEGARLDDVIAALAAEISVFKDVADIAPPAGFRISGQKIARQTHRDSGRTAMLANISVHEPKPPNDPDSPLSFSMEGYQGQPPSSLIPRFWAPGWNSVQSVNKFQSEVGGPLHGGDPGKKLLEPAKANKAYFDNIPIPFSSRKGEWLLVHIAHIFGSEELSVLSPAIAELTPKPYLGLNPGDAADLNLKEGDNVKVIVNGKELRLPVRQMPQLPAGMAGFPVLPGTERLVLPGWGKIARSEKWTA